LFSPCLRSATGFLGSVGFGGMSGMLFGGSTCDPSFALHIVYCPVIMLTLHLTGSNVHQVQPIFPKKRSETLIDRNLDSFAHVDMHTPKQDTRNTSCFLVMQAHNASFWSPIVCLAVTLN
jgi:hypothetical protein